MARGPGLSIAISEKRFAGGATPVFSGFGLEVAPGSVLAVLGPSGIGKSTLLRLVAGIDGDYQGSITIDGLAALQAPPPGFVFQDARLLPWLTALDNVRAGLPHLSQAQGITWLDKVGLAEDAHAYPRQLSGGMQRRVALARALAMNEHLLLLDEPFVSLDRALADEMQALLGSLIDAAQATALLVTHQPEEAARLADRVVVLAERPARITGDVALPVPRRQRDKLQLAKYISLLENMVPSSIGRVWS
jgi:NitT/TauT family transport system ATP-binding protein/sulfonate transport system ATP-binding protein